MLGLPPVDGGGRSAARGWSVLQFWIFHPGGLPPADKASCRHHTYGPARSPHTCGPPLIRWGADILQPSRHSGRPPPTRVSHLLPSPAARRMHGDERRPGGDVIDCGSRAHPASGPLVAIVRPGMEHARLREHHPSRGGGWCRRVFELTLPPNVASHCPCRHRDAARRRRSAPLVIRRASNAATLRPPGVASIGTRT